METTETRTKKWRESDGTEVTETTTIRRIRPLNTKNSSTTVSNISKNDTSATVNYDSNQFEKDSLNRHNHYRAKHGVPDLVLSKQVSKDFIRYFRYY